MIDLIYSNIINYLLQVLPDMRQYYEVRIEELCAAGNPHVVYGSIFVEYINSLASGIGGHSHNMKNRMLKECFRLIEELSSSSDFQTRCLVETSVIEALLGEKGGLERFAPYMGLKTKMIARDVARRWDLDVGLLT